MRQKPICAEMNKAAEVKNNKMSERRPACVSECSRGAILCLLISEEIQPPALDIKTGSQTKVIALPELSSQSSGD